MVISKKQNIFKYTAIKIIAINLEQGEIQVSKHLDNIMWEMKNRIEQAKPAFNKLKISCNNFLP